MGWGAFSSSTSLEDKRVESPRLALTSLNLSPETKCVPWTAANLEVRNLPQQIWKSGGKWNNVIQEKVQTRRDLGTELKLDQEKISHPTITSAHIPILSHRASVSLRGQTVDAISHLEGGPGSAEVVPWVTWPETSPVTAKSPPWGHRHTQVMYLFLSFPTASFLSWWHPGQLQGKNGKVSPQPVDHCWQRSMSLQPVMKQASQKYQNKQQWGISHEDFPPKYSVN